MNNINNVINTLEIIINLFEIMLISVIQYRVLCKLRKFTSFSLLTDNYNFNRAAISMHKSSLALVSL